MKKWQILPLFLMLFMVVSCGNLPDAFQPQLNSELNIQTSGQSGDLIATGGEDNNFLAELADLITDTEDADKAESLAYDLAWLQNNPSEPFDLRPYRIPAKIPTEEYDPNFNYFSMGHNGIYWHFAVPNDVYGRWYFDHKDAHGRTTGAIIPSRNQK